MALTTESALRKDKRNAQADLGQLQHRHFAAIAGILAELVDTYDNPLSKRDVVEAFADKLRHTNANFNRARFLRACGYPE